jgi:hypothetical protein
MNTTERLEYPPKPIRFTGREHWSGSREAGRWEVCTCSLARNHPPEEPEQPTEPPTFAELVERAGRLKDVLTERFATAVTEAGRRTERKMHTELAAALGVSPDDFGWQSLMSMVTGVRTVADTVIGLAQPGVDEAKREQFLVSLGVSEQWARVRLEAEREGERLGLVPPTEPPAAGSGEPPDSPGSRT